MTTDWEETAAAAAVGATLEQPEIKLFGRWSSSDVQVSDISLTVSESLLFRIESDCVPK